MSTVSNPLPSSLFSGDDNVFVVLGGTGNVGSGVVFDALSYPSTTVIVVGRDGNKLNSFKQKLKDGHGLDISRLHTVTADFSNDEATKQAGNDIAQLLTKLGKSKINHVVSNLGYGVQVTEGPSKTDISRYQAMMDTCIYPNIRASSVILPLLSSNNASFSLISGGLAHFTMANSTWIQSMKNATVNSLIPQFQKEYEQSNIRFYSVCIHFAVAEIGGTKNQGGWDGFDTRKLGYVFLAVAANTNIKGQVVCVPPEELDTLPAKLLEQK